VQSKINNPEKLTRRHRTKTNQKHNIICVAHHNTQTNTNNVNKTRTLLQITGGKDHRFYEEIVTCNARILGHVTF